MTTFDETQHPRRGSGQFDRKAQSDAEVTLPGGAPRAADTMESQLELADRIELLVLERFPTARTIHFDVEHDFGRPVITHINHGSEVLWQYGADDIDPEFTGQVSDLGLQMSNPYLQPDSNARLIPFKDEMDVFRDWQVWISRANRDAVRAGA